jgi:ABC-type glycerol-3-phosphate transport system substrate-binding protein
MIQNDTDMVSKNKKEAYFDHSEERDDKIYYPGTSALKFYTDFALPKKRAYTWNNSMDEARKEFIAGNASMMFGYSADIWEIKKRAPKLRFKVTEVPQVKKGDKIAYASFWSEVVSKNSQNQKTAWDFLKFCTDKENITLYYEAKEKAGETVPSSLVEKAKTQEGRTQDIGPIVKQASYAKGWYKGDALKMEAIFLKMINAVNGGQSPQAAIDAAAKNATKMLGEISQ